MESLVLVYSTHGNFFRSENNVDFDFNLLNFDALASIVEQMWQVGGASRLIGLPVAVVATSKSLSHVG